MIKVSFIEEPHILVTFNLILYLPALIKLIAILVESGCPEESKNKLDVSAKEFPLESKTLHLFLMRPQEPIVLDVLLKLIVLFLHLFKGL